MCLLFLFEFLNIVMSRKTYINYIVAMFEADAQIAFLQMNGIADIAISEDSDLLVFGCDKVCVFF